jgi:tetratricopeptide (TPR) repeat protein
VLADALTQLGDPAATETIQRMLDLRPSLASFTRASYDLELHGKLTEARQAMERALADANSPDQAAFCHYHLGELAFNAGDLDEAQLQYEAAPDEVLSRHGRAKVAAARGELDAALDGYRELVAIRPSTAYLHDYAELLTAAGRPSEADAQYAVIEEQLRLAPDNLEASNVAAGRGDGQSALRLARAEWDRRQHVDVADALSWALHLTGQNAEALTYADRAAELGGVNATFVYHRGMILRDLGLTEQATEALATALRINPYFSPVDAPLAEAALAQLRAGR